MKIKSILIISWMVLSVLSFVNYSHAVDAWNVELIGYYNTSGYAFGIAVNGNHAYVGDEGSGLRVIDISKPNDPVEVGHYDTPGRALGVTISGNYAYVADYDAGLRVIDIRNSSNPQEVGYYDTPGYAIEVIIKGNYAYIADVDSGLRIIDVTTATNPFEVGSYDTPGLAEGIAISGNYAYIADDTFGLRIIDISNPSQPNEVGFCITEGEVFGVAVHDNYAYVADGAAGLCVVNIGDPYHPFAMSYYTTGYRAIGVAADDSCAYVTDFNNGLRVFDISNPNHLKEIGFYDTQGNAINLCIENNLIFLADFLDGLYILRFFADIKDIPDVKLFKDDSQSAMFCLNRYLKNDISTHWSWSSQTTFANISIDSTSWVDYLSPLSSTAGQDTVLFSTASSGSDYSILKYSTYLLNRFPDVLIDNGNQITNCKFDLDSFVSKKAGDPYPSIYLTELHSDYPSDTSRLRILQNANTLEIIPNISPYEIGQYTTSGWTHGIYVQDKYAYIANGSNGLRILDISNPTIPVEVGFYDTPGWAYRVKVSGNYAYVADGTRGLRIIDISNPTAPFEIGAFEPSSSYYVDAVDVQGNYAYIVYGIEYGSGYVWLTVLDISNPAAPIQIGQRSFYSYHSDPFFDISVRGNYAYIVLYDEYLRIIDISDPTAPFFAGYYHNSSMHAKRVLVDTNYAYIIDGHLRIIDISDPTSPIEIGNLFDQTSSGMMCVYMRDKYAYVGDKYRGLRIVDISNPAIPFEIASYKEPSPSNYGDEDIFVRDNYAYFTIDTAGLRIIDIGPNTMPLHAPAEIIVTATPDSTSNDWDKEVIHVYELLDTYGEFTVVNDAWHYWFELPEYGASQLPLFSWMSSFNGRDGVLGIQFSPEAEGTKIVLNQELDVKPYTWYRLQCSFASDGDIGNQHQVRGTLFAIDTETGAVEFGGFARQPGQLKGGNWYTQDAYVYTNGNKLRPMLIFKNNGSPGTIYLDYLRVYEYPPMTERAYGALAKIPISNGSFDDGLSG